MEELVGRTLLRRYRIDAFLGRGGMAEVYRAYDTRRNHPVAVKVLREDLAEDREFLRRFRAEAEALARLAHQNIVRFYSFEQEGRTAFIVMGKDADIVLEWLSVGKLEPDEYYQVEIKLVRTDWESRDSVSLLARETRYQCLKGSNGHGCTESPTSPKKFGSHLNRPPTGALPRSWCVTLPSSDHSARRQRFRVSSGDNTEPDPLHERREEP